MEPRFEQAATDTAREHPRFEAHSVIRLYWTDLTEKSDEVRSCSAVCTDIAIGGIGAYTVNDFAVGDVLGVEFLETPLSIMAARIVYRNGFDYGLKFLDIV
jgi:hypothetical protein